MLDPVVCFSCGLPIDDRADLFREMRAARVRATLKDRGTTATQAAVDAGLQIDCTDIFVQLGFKEDCCRAHLTSAMSFADYY